MDDLYRDTTTKMEESNTDPEYILGWQGGYLNHPERESQRASEAYLAGYNDGKAKNTNSFSKWTK